MLNVKRLCCVIAISCALVASVYAASSLVVNPSQVGPFYLSPGTNGTVQTVEAFNAGTGDFDVTASTSASWLVATTGTLHACTIKQTSNCVPISVALNTSGLTPGSYTEYLPSPFPEQWTRPCRYR